VSKPTVASLARRVAALEAELQRLAQRVADYNRIEQIMARAGMPEPVRALAEAEADRAHERDSRHLRAVK
jgi:hypothetical protein